MRVFDRKEAIIEHCAQTNAGSYNFEKVIEEIAEFQEVMAKLKTKHPDNPKRPTNEDLLREFGDLIYRGVIYLAQQFPTMGAQKVIDKVEAHIEKKLTGLEEHLKDKVYKGGL